MDVSSYLSKIETLMSMGGLFGVKKRAMSNGSEDFHSDGFTDREREAMVRHHSDIVMKKTRLFADMW